MPSQLEESLAFQLKVLARNFPIPTREYRFHPPRKWRFDFAWTAQHLAVEVEGGTWVNGRHTRGSSFAADCEKYNTAILDGWRVLKFTGAMIESGEAVTVIIQALNAS